jgi:fatty-acyl-CoA synthase
MANKYEIGLDKNPANHRPMTPITLLERAADVFPDRLAVIHGNRRFTWAQHAQRCRSLARALVGEGIQRGDTVAILASNIP